MKALRRAFTLVELVFVIMVFGIIAAIGSEVYVKIYENYLITRSMNSLQTKTETALEQIAKRLQYRIKSSAIGVKPDFSSFITASDPNMDNSFTILEWIGYDETGFKGEYNATRNYFTPGWSGFIDLDASTSTTLSTPGSRLNSVDAIITDLSNGLSSIADAAIIFPDTWGDFNISRYGWYGNRSDYVYDIGVIDDTSFQITDAIVTPAEIYERYKLVWTAFAIAPDPIDCTNGCDLVLYWNYQPWSGERFDTAQNVFRNLLVENVTTFKFRQDGDVMRIKLCAGERVVDNNISVCKEKVVF